MVRLQNEDRDLMLSMYIDGELDPDQRGAVEEKLRSDPNWREEYDSLLSSDQKISKVVENNWHDSDLTSRIMGQVRTQPRPSTHTARIAELNERQSRPMEKEGNDATRNREKRTRLFGWTAAAAALILFALSLEFVFYKTPLPDPKGGERQPLTLLGTFNPENAQLTGIDKRDRRDNHSIYQGGVLVSKAPGARLSWADGSTIWLKAETRLVAAGLRSAHLECGRLFIKVAPQSPPSTFHIRLPDGSTVEALGTSFEIEVDGKGSHVRVVEGKVSRRSEKGNSIIALGGQEIEPDLGLTHWDPRGILETWGALAQTRSAKTEIQDPGETLAPWPQIGGTPGHTGTTPLQGPKGQFVARHFKAFPTLNDNSGSSKTLNYPAVIGSGNRAYTLIATSEQASQLYALTLDDPNENWKACGEPVSGMVYGPPVITSANLVVFGTSAEKVIAWDPGKERVAWRAEVQSSVWALTAAYDGTILCSTYRGLIALDGQGKEKWSYTDLKDIRAPSSVMPDGRIVAFSRLGNGFVLTAGSKNIDAKSVSWPDKKGFTLIGWPLVVQHDGSIWVTLNDGLLTGFQADGLKMYSGVKDSGLACIPLGTGIYARQNVIHFPGGQEVALPLKSSVTALAQDGSGAVFAGLGDNLYRVLDPSKHPDAKPVVDSTRGEVVQGGIAVLPGKIVVTTSKGIQIFE